MSDNDFFDSSDYQQTSGTRARAASINAALDAIDAGFQKLPDEADIKRGTINYTATDTGAANAYVVSIPSAPTAFVDGMQVVFKAVATNTGASTINVNALGVKNIKRQDGSALISGDIQAGKICQLRYNSTSAQFEVQSSIGVASGAGTMAAQNANAVSITGGTVTGITDLAVADGGTGASSASGALTNLGLTASASEINTACDGITASAAEINTACDGVTATAAEINRACAGIAATAAEINTACDGVTATAAELNKAADGIGTTIPRMVILTIGDWNMDSTASVNVAHGLSFSKIIGVTGTVRNDANNAKYPISSTAGGNLAISSIDGTNITLTRDGSGTFDSTSFDSTSYNRGYLIVSYID